MGFEVSPNDPCVAIKDTVESECTVCWPVDDLKVLHKEEMVVTYFAGKLAKQNQDKTKFKRGEVFDYLDMELDFESEPIELIVSMNKYL